MSFHLTGLRATDPNFHWYKNCKLLVLKQPITVIKHEQLVFTAPFRYNDQDN